MQQVLCRLQAVCQPAHLGLRDGGGGGGGALCLKTSVTELLIACG